MRRARLALRVDLAAVEGAALFLVPDNLVGRSNLGETLLRSRLLALIGMVFLGELAEGGLDFGRARRFRHSKNVIWITHYEPILRRRLVRSADANVSLAYLGLCRAPCKSGAVAGFSRPELPKASPSLEAVVDSDCGDYDGCAGRATELTGNASGTVLSASTQPDFTEAEDPIALFGLWLEEASKAEINDPEAMALATVDDNGLPDVRMLLCKGVDARGLAFYGNVESAKGRELASRPKAAALFHWKSLRRQARFRGPVSPLTDAEADTYFASRARQSRIGAWASQQSRPLEFARRARGGGRGLRQALRRQRHSAAGLLARLAACAGRDRVLA